MTAPSGVGRAREAAPATHAAPAKPRPRAFVLGRDRKSVIPPMVIDQAISAFRHVANLALAGMAAAGLVRRPPQPRRRVRSRAPRNPPCGSSQLRPLIAARRGAPPPPRPHPLPTRCHARPCRRRP
jgi:hypothetical protein